MPIFLPMSIAAGIVLTSEGEAAGEASEAVSYQPSAISIQPDFGSWQRFLIATSGSRPCFDFLGSGQLSAISFQPDAPTFTLIQFRPNHHLLSTQPYATCLKLMAES